MNTNAPANPSTYLFDRLRREGLGPREIVQGGGVGGGAFIKPNDMQHFRSVPQFFGWNDCTWGHRGVTTDHSTDTPPRDGVNFIKACWASLDRSKASSSVADIVLSETNEL